MNDVNRLLNGNGADRTNGTSAEAQPMSPEAISAWKCDKAARRAKEGPFADWL